MLAGRFELVRPLGSGGLAEVWMARDRVTGSEVAIKALHAHLSRDVGLCERFRREMAVTRGLDHPGIVKVFDLHEHGGQGGQGGRPFFAMELLRGRTLAEQLQGGPLERAEALRISREITVALQAAHRAGVVHRDLKPQNIFVTSSGAVKLLDFGLARAAGQARMTAASTVLGTPGYIAPEVLEGAAADGRADLYALGAVIFELFSGQRAFASVDAYAVLLQKRAPPLLRTAAPGATEADEALVARCLEPDPERRFLDAGQVLRALDGEPVPAAPTAAPALTSGGFDVLVRSSFRFGYRARLRRVLARVGAPEPGLAWMTRLSVTGRATLAAGASRGTAEALVAACHAEGIGAQMVPHRPRGRFARWLGRQGWFAPAAALVAPAYLLALAVVGELDRRSQSMLRWQWSAVALLPVIFGLPLGAITAWLASAVQGAARTAPLDSAAADLKEPRLGRWLQHRPTLKAVLLGGGWTLLLATVLSLLDLVPLASGSDFEWRRLGPDLAAGFFPPMLLWIFLNSFCLAIALRQGWSRRLSEGDPAVRRLEDGIARRLEALRQRLRSAPGATQMLLDELREAAEELGAQAKSLAARAATLEAPATRLPASEQPTLPLGMAGGRDLALDRLLEIAAALDDALAVAGGAIDEGSAGGARAHEDASRELHRLRAAAVLPEGTSAAAPPGDPSAAVETPLAGRRSRA